MSNEKLMTQFKQQLTNLDQLESFFLNLTEHEDYKEPVTKRIITQLMTSVDYLRINLEDLRTTTIEKIG